MSPANVLITGANRGIGLEFVKQYAQLQPNCPQHVFAGCRSPDSAKDLQDLQTKYKNIKIVKIDLNDEATYASAAKAVEEVVGDAGLNLLINNAGAANRASLDTVTSEDMVSLFQINAVGPLMLTKAFLPLLRKAAAKGGAMSSDRACVINISTGVASITENDTGGAYSYRTSKAALNMITKNLSLDLKKDGILVSAIHPGWIKTGMGGPKATTEASDCIEALLKVIDSLNSEESSGKLYHYSGRVMPW
ncbi:C-factor-like [Mercenaria mercenaria]|uniref:C-factor-like n=1 Tax=Mercenaria mercenaria TaxID=6596 RepID=UPI00234F9948|nr:C-factor-like [Mercenaria mercenaria]XP_045173478.2 C-factor-like [Mercenaria mercenaria]